MQELVLFEGIDWSLLVAVVVFAVAQWRISVKNASVLASQHEMITLSIANLLNDLSEFKSYLYKKVDVIDKNKEQITLLVASQTRCAEDIGRAHRSIETLSNKQYDLEKAVYSRLGNNPK